MPSITHVEIAPQPLERFRSLLNDQFAEIEEAAADALELFSGRVIWQISSTARGGGVAEMLRSHLAYVRAIGIDTRWLVVGGGDDFFRLTKRIHNNLHGFPGDGGELGDAQRATFESALVGAARELGQLVREGDVVFIHDPQPLGLISGLRAAGAKVLWRCHIGTDEPNELTYRAWDFLRPYVLAADAYAFSREHYIWEGLDGSKVWIVPPSIDPFSPKNQELGADASEAILDVTGVAEGRPGRAVYRRTDGSPARVDRRAQTVQDAPVPAGAPLLAQISRWDRLKDPAGFLACFTQHCEAPGAHLLLVGPDVASVTDDPEGAEVLAEIEARRVDLPEDLRARVHLASLPMDDIEENAAMVNALQRRADVIMQKSLAEGFGLTVAEAMWKERAVVASEVGRDPGPNRRWRKRDPAGRSVRPRGSRARRLRVAGRPARSARMGQAARERVSQDFLTTKHLVTYLKHFTELIRGRLQP